jgi:hypothetical protein
MADDILELFEGHLCLQDVVGGSLSFLNAMVKVRERKAEARYKEMVKANSDQASGQKGRRKGVLRNSDFADGRRRPSE